MRTFYTALENIIRSAPIQQRAAAAAVAPAPDEAVGMDLDPPYQPAAASAAEAPAAPPAEHAENKKRALENADEAPAAGSHPEETEARRVRQKLA